MRQKLEMVTLFYSDSTGSIQSTMYFVHRSKSCTVMWLHVYFTVGAFVIIQMTFFSIQTLLTNYCWEYEQTYFLHIKLKWPWNTSLAFLGCWSITKKLSVKTLIRIKQKTPKTSNITGNYYIFNFIRFLRSQSILFPDYTSKLRI